MVWSSQQLVGRMPSQPNRHFPLSFFSCCTFAATDLISTLAAARELLQSCFFLWSHFLPVFQWVAVFLLHCLKCFFDEHLYLSKKCSIAQVLPFLPCALHFFCFCASINWRSNGPLIEKKHLLFSRLQKATRVIGELCFKIHCYCFIELCGTVKIMQE